MSMVKLWTLNVRLTSSGFQLALFFTLALLSVISRLAVRLTTRKRLYMDNYLVLLAAAALCVVTGINFKVLSVAYLVDATGRGLITPTTGELNSELNITRWTHIFIPYMWLVV